MAQPAVAGADSEVLETLRRWWGENGRFIGFGLTLAVIAVGGWEVWSYYQERRAAAAAEQYFSFIERLESTGSDESKDLGDPTGIEDDIPGLPVQEYAGSPYLTFARLRRADYFVEHGELEKAAGDLRWVADNEEHPALSELALARHARVLIALDRAEEAIAALEERVFSPASGPVAEEVFGDALMKLGRRQEAITAYRAAWQAYDIREARPLFLRIKLELLGQNVAALPNVPAN